MHLEKSCGAVIYTMQNGQHLFVVVQEQSGAYSFPKGRMQCNESEIETACREIFEETGLRPRFLNGFRETDEFEPSEKPGTRKQIVYFLAECENPTFVPQEGEIRNIILLPYELAAQCFKHKGTLRVLTNAYHFLTGQ